MGDKRWRKVKKLSANEISDLDVTVTGMVADIISSSGGSDITAEQVKTLYESNDNTNVFTDAEQAKLSGLEEGAQVNPSAAEVKVLYETNANTNAFTDAEKTKLSGVASGATANQTNAYLLARANHTGAQAMSTVTGLQSALDNKVDKVAGKQLSTEDYTTAEKNKLAGLSNYDDTAIQTALSGKVNTVAGKQLSTEDFTTAQKNKLDSFTPSAFIADSPTDTIESLAEHVDSIRDAMISSGFMLPE